MKSPLFAAALAGALVGSRAELRGLRSESDSGYEKHSNRACRAQDGEDSTQGYDFYRVSRAHCKRKCNNSDTKCFGYQYSFMVGFIENVDCHCASRFHRLTS